jgi:hypothetical protein
VGKPIQMAVDPMAQILTEPSKPVLDPMERISEVLFGLVMALTFTCTLGAATADTIKVKTMLVAALGCNLAWGIIDAGVFLMARLSQRARNVAKWRAVRDATDVGAAQRVVADAMPPLLAAVLLAEQLEVMRQRLLQMPEPEHPRLTKNEGLGALGICLLSFLSTFPIVIPFLLISETRAALRVSNAVAIAMLFLCGYAFGHYVGFRPWGMGLTMVGVGAALVGVAIALGG